MDLVSSLDGNWKCSGTLMVLELVIVAGRTPQEIRRLFFQLKELSRLTDILLNWRQIGSETGSRRSGRTKLSLEDLNEGAEDLGLRLMTKEDMTWMGLL